MKKDNGGPAFPIPLNPGSSYQGHGGEVDGMTLRDYIAIHASDLDLREYAVYKRVDRVTTKGGTRNVHTDDVLDVPATRYAYADAMLLERTK